MENDLIVPVALWKVENITRNTLSAPIAVCSPKRANQRKTKMREDPAMYSSKRVRFSLCPDTGHIRYVCCSFSSTLHVVMLMVRRSLTSQSRLGSLWKSRTTYFRKF